MHSNRDPDSGRYLGLSAQLQESVAHLTADRYRAHFFELAGSADRLFQVLMLVQFLGVLLVALTLTPLTWIGASEALHIHVKAALLIGASLTLVVWYVATTCPGRSSNKYVIAIAQTLMSLLLIHITGGRIETHFHIFGSLAFLALYRSYGVFLLVTGLVALDHGARNYLWPQSIFGLTWVESWRWLEHVGWVAFEDVVLIVATSKKRKEMWASAERWALLSVNKQVVDEAVQRQTQELADRQRKLEEGTARLRSVVDTAYDAYIGLNHQLQVKEWSRRATELTGWNAEDVLGRPCAEVLQLSELLVSLEYALSERAGKELNEVERAYTANQLVETGCQAANGQHLYAEASWSITGQSPEIAVNIFLRDVTGRRQLASQELHSHKMEAIGQLAAGIAHEINTPIQFVGDNLCFLDKACGQIDELLQLVRQAHDPACPTRTAASEKLTTKLNSQSFNRVASEIPKALEQSHEGIERISSITRAMKEFSHPGTVSMVHIDLHNAIKSTLTVCRNEWKYVAEVVTDFTDEVSTVECHPSELNQVIINLVVNAAHAIGEVADRFPAGKGKIVVRTRRVETMVEIEVEDNGPGIPEVIRNRIYDPFFTTKPVGKGTGQGLAIVHSVMHRHHGSIEMESTVGQGTKFVLRFPIVQSDQYSNAKVEVFADETEAVHGAVAYNLPLVVSATPSAAYQAATSV